MSYSLLFVWLDYCFVWGQRSNNKAKWVNFSKSVKRSQISKLSCWSLAISNFSSKVSCESSFQAECVFGNKIGDINWYQDCKRGQIKGKHVFDKMKILQCFPMLLNVNYSSIHATSMSWLNLASVHNTQFVMRNNDIYCSLQYLAICSCCSMKINRIK